MRGEKSWKVVELQQFQLLTTAREWEHVKLETYLRNSKRNQWPS